MKPVGDNIPTKWSADLSIEMKVDYYNKVFYLSAVPCDADTGWSG